MGTEGFLLARDDFHRARRQAALQEILARLAGKSIDLFSYEDVRLKLKATESSARVLRDVPLDAIVGSVGRTSDFTRDFLPRRDSDEERWARVKMAVEDMAGLPPVELYKIGEVYFVSDGHHRISIARQEGAKHIEAYVTEVRTKVPLTPDVRPEDLILKAEYAGFLDRTRLDELRPGSDLSLTTPGEYQVLEEHISVHRYFMGIDQKREIPYKEAVAHWYDTIYLPVVETIRQRGLQRDFSGKTEADLYIWLSRHCASLREELDWEVDRDAAATDLAARFSPTLPRAIARIGEKVLDAVMPDEVEFCPTPGEWRQERVETRSDDRLFTDILVPISGDESGWSAVDQAIEVSRREGGRLHGLYVARTKSHRESEEARAARAEFNKRCEEARVPGNLAVDVGGVARQICERARYADLVVVNLAHPPASQPFARLKSGFRTMIRRCARPVLAVPGTASPLTSALLAFDGSQKANEALYVAAYLAGRWAIPLTVLTVAEPGQTTPEPLARAQRYLEDRGAKAQFVTRGGAVATAILETADERGCDLILMGGYGFRLVMEIVLGSAVDEVLRVSRKPTLICQ